MDTLDQNTGEGLHISSSITDFLTTTYKWTKFLSVLGFVMLGLIVFSGLFTIILGANLQNGSGQIVGIGITYLIMCAVYFFPTLYLYNFSVKMKRALTTHSQEELEDSFENLKSLFKFTGIFTIIILSLYIVFIIFGSFAFGLLLSMMR